MLDLCALLKYYGCIVTHVIEAKPHDQSSYVTFFLQSRLLSPDFGKQLLEVEDLLQKHSLLEADIAVQAERVRSANAAALKFANGDSE